MDNQINRYCMKCSRGIGLYPLSGIYHIAVEPCPNCKEQEEENE